MTGFVKKQSDFDEAIAEINRRGWPLHKWNHYKNWDSVWLDYIMRDGDMLDIGCVTSMPLFIANHLGLKGRKVGIDLADSFNYLVDTTPWERPQPAELLVGKAESLPFANDSFVNLACLSVVEHGVDLDLFAQEAARVLCRGGRFVVTFDFWPWPKPEYDILIWSDLIHLTDRLVKHGFSLEEIDCSLMDKTIDGLFTFGCVRGFKM